MKTQVQDQVRTAIEQAAAPAESRGEEGAALKVRTGLKAGGGSTLDLGDTYYTYANSANKVISLG
jgi:hypothetical protein